MTNFNQQSLTSRNYLYISDELQEKIGSAKLAFFGVGLSSTIALQAVRLGFTNLYLRDGDKVELSNLNRQAFGVGDLGCFKAEALRHKIMEINPLASVHYAPNFVSNMDDIKDIIKNSDIIINTIDCTQLYFDLIEYGRNQNKLVICPYNPGFSGLVLNFTKDSSSVYDEFDLKGPLDDFEITKQLFNKYPQLKTLEQANSTLDNFLLNARSTYFPQMVIGAAITSSMVLTTMVRYLNGDPIIKMPSIYHMDLVE